MYLGLLYFVGCGAAGIFSLLIARMYEWNMLGTEINDESVIIANQNVNQNNLQHLVKSKLFYVSTVD